MKRTHKISLMVFITVGSLLLGGGFLSANDTCMFQVTSDDMPPNVIFLLDNGAEMQHTVWPGSFDNSREYSPKFDGSPVLITGVKWLKAFKIGEMVEGFITGATAKVIGVKWTGSDTADIALSPLVGELEGEENIFSQTDPTHEVEVTGFLPAVDGLPKDVVHYGTEAGNGFYNQNDYSVFKTGGSYYLVPVGEDMLPETGIQLQETGGKGSGTWTINGRTITLPVEADTKIDTNGILDKAGFFRYSKNYLNWLFFSGEYTGDGTDLPAKSRFYYAKKALLDVGKLTSNKAYFAIFNFTSTSEGASSVQPIGEVVEMIGDIPANNTLNVNYVNNLNNMGTVTYSPLSEGLALIGGYIDSNSIGAVTSLNFCQKTFVIVVSTGISSEDKSDSNQAIPRNMDDFDGEGTDGYGTNGPATGTLTVDGNIFTIPTNYNGSTYLDDIAHYFFTHDMRVSNDPVGGWQNVSTYTIGFMASADSRRYLINTSNNGNGNLNLVDSTDSEYGKYHFDAESPEGLTQAILDAVNDIITRTSTFIAPVVPVTRTMSGDKIYMAFFKPGEENFWQGYVTKFGLDSQNQIIDVNGNEATWPNGAVKKVAVPMWSTLDWADTSKNNGVGYSTRNIYTHIDPNFSISHADNSFSTGNDKLTADILGNPLDITVSNDIIVNQTISGRNKVIDYIRGADVLDENENGIITENRSFITGDVLHGEPFVMVYNYADNTSKTFVYFGANDGMLHAVLDQIDPDTLSDGDETDHGTEAWAFIPPNQLSRLKLILEGSTHEHYLDSSPVVYFHDIDHDGFVDTDDGDRIVLVCGERKGGSGYFALEITDPDAPEYLYRIDSSGNPETLVPELGQSWSEPVFATVKTSNSGSDGIPVFFIGGGYSADNSSGNAVIAINVFTGEIVRKFTAVSGETIDLNRATHVVDMNYSIASTVRVIDENDNGLIDKVYVGDLGGQVWRFGKFDTDADGNPLTFPDSDENIDNWTAHVLLRAPSYIVDTTTYTRKFYYPPSVTFESGYDLIFLGSGDREEACDQSTEPDRIYSIKDAHISSTVLIEEDLVDVTDPVAATPDLKNDTGDVDLNGASDQGRYVRLVDDLGQGTGEKVLAEGTVYNKVYYVTTFAPNNLPCQPGGAGKLYALNYLTGAAVLTFGNDSDGDGIEDPTRSVMIGGGIPSKPVMVISRTSQKMLISVGSTNPDAGSESIDAGIIRVDPLLPNRNFYYIWWRQLFN